MLICSSYHDEHHSKLLNFIVDRTLVTNILITRQSLLFDASKQSKAKVQILIISKAYGFSYKISFV